jgi:hypothetical protein
MVYKFFLAVSFEGRDRTSFDYRSLEKSRALIEQLALKERHAARTPVFELLKTPPQKIPQKLTYGSAYSLAGVAGTSPVFSVPQLSDSDMGIRSGAASPRMLSICSPGCIIRWGASPAIPFLSLPS